MQLKHKMIRTYMEKNIDTDDTTDILKQSINMNVFFFLNKKRHLNNIWTVQVIKTKT